MILFRYSLVLIPKWKCLLGAGRICWEEIGTPSTIISVHDAIVGIMDLGVMFLWHTALLYKEMELWPFCTCHQFPFRQPHCQANLALRTMKNCTKFTRLQFCILREISLQNLHIDSKTYASSNTIKSSPPSAVYYMCQWTGSALVQIMTCRLFGAKPLSEPMLIYCKLDT